MTQDTENQSGYIEASHTTKDKREVEPAQLKVVIRRLPPSLTAEVLLDQISPVPEHDYFSFVKADLSLGQCAFSRAYINFLHINDIITFRDKFDGYVFVDSKGNEYPAMVEFAPFQKIPKKKAKKLDSKKGTIEQDSDYLKFLETLSSEQNEPVLPPERYLEQIEAREKELRENKGPTASTPLLDYIKKKREDRRNAIQRARDERRKREEERKRKREEERRRRKDRERQREKEREKENDKEKTKIEEGASNSPQIKLLKNPERENVKDGKEDDYKETKGVSNDKVAPRKDDYRDTRSGGRTSVVRDRDRRRPLPDRDVHRERNERQYGEKERFRERPPDRLRDRDVDRDRRRVETSKGRHETRYEKDYHDKKYEERSRNNPSRKNDRESDPASSRRNNREADFAPTRRNDRDCDTTSSRRNDRESETSTRRNNQDSESSSKNNDTEIVKERTKKPEREAKTTKDTEKLAEVGSISKDVDTHSKTKTGIKKTDVKTASSQQTTDNKSVTKATQKASRVETSDKDESKRERKETPEEEKRRERRERVCNKDRPERALYVPGRRRLADGDKEKTPESEARKTSSQESVTSTNKTESEN